MSALTYHTTLVYSERECSEMERTEAMRVLLLRKSIMSDLLNAAKNAGLTISAIYEWLERVEKAGGATSIEGVAACHAMLTSLRKNADRTEKLVMAPLRAAIEAEERKKNPTA